MKLKPIILLFSSLLVCAKLIAEPVQVAPLETNDSARLTAALDSIEAKNIGADLRFLASDELEGRNTPGRGLRVAARFIRSRLQRLGFTPGAGDGFLQRYQLEHRAVDLDRTSFQIERPSAAGDAGERLQFSFTEDYVFTNGEVFDDLLEAQVVGAGRGQRDDLEGLDVAGKWALCMDTGRHSGMRRRLLMKAGARGVIVLPDKELPDQSRLEKIERSAAWATRGTIEYPLKAIDGELGEEKAPTDHFHQVYLTMAGFDRLSDFSGGASAAELSQKGRSPGWTARDQRGLPGDGGLIEVENVCGFWPGKDPELAREVILISAHYDHVGIKAGQIYNGADDNASGTSGLLALAEALTHYGPLQRSVMLIWVSAEEKGLYGSQAWVESPTLPVGSRAICNVNIDMIGRNEADGLYVTPSKAHRAFNGLTRFAMEFAPLEGFTSLASADPYYQRSDHANFAKLGIPVAFFFNGEHADYHKATDTFEKIDTDKIRRVTRLVLRLIDALQTETLDL